MLQTHYSTLVYIMLFCEWVPKLCTCLYVRHKLDVCYMCYMQHERKLHVQFKLDDRCTLVSHK